MFDPDGVFPKFVFFVPSTGEEEDSLVGEPGQGEAENGSYWNKKKEAFLRGSSVSVGDKHSSGTHHVCLYLTQVFLLKS